MEAQPLANGGLDPVTPSPPADPLSLLRASRLFSIAPEDELREIAAHLTSVHFAAGETIIREGEPGNACYLVCDGEAGVVSRDLIGQEVTLATFSAGACFGEIALVREVPRTATVRALSDIQAFSLDRAEFDGLEDKCPAFAAHLRRHAELLELDRFLRRASPFARLPYESVRQLAAELRPVSVKRGNTVIREGDRGDEFYLVRAGRLEVLKRDKTVQVLEAGDCFGEVALLAAERRTATVRALEDAELLALARPQFEAVVKEHRSASGLMGELVRIRHSIAARSAPPTEELGAKAPPILPSVRWPFWAVVGGGILAFALLSVLALSTGEPALGVVALLTGAFVGPVSYVTYLAGSNILRHRPLILTATFALGAAFGLPLAFFLLRWLGLDDTGLATGVVVGLIEEPAKLLGVLWLLGRPSSRFRMDGVIYGAAAGMGFAAFENILYGLERIDVLTRLISTLWLRTLLSPFGHGTWTAIICAAIWRQKGSGPPRLDGPVVAAFAISVGLHALWDWQLLPGFFSLAWFLGVGATGLLVLRANLRRAAAEEVYSVLALNPELWEAAGAAQRVRATCRRCGQVAPPGAHYCARCGSALRRD